MFPIRTSMNVKCPSHGVDQPSVYILRVDRGSSAYNYRIIYQTCVPGSDLSGSRAHRDVSTQIFLKASRQQLGLATLLTLTFNVFLRGVSKGRAWRVMIIMFSQTARLQSIRKTQRFNLFKSGKSRQCRDLIENLYKSLQQQLELDKKVYKVSKS